MTIFPWKIGLTSHTCKASILPLNNNSSPKRAFTMCMWGGGEESGFTRDVVPVQRLEDNFGCWSLSPPCLKWGLLLCTTAHTPLAGQWVYWNSPASTSRVAIRVPVLQALLPRLALHQYKTSELRFSYCKASTWPTEPCLLPLGLRKFYYLYLFVWHIQITLMYVCASCAYLVPWRSEERGSDLLDLSCG